MRRLFESIVFLCVGLMFGYGDVWAQDETTRDASSHQAKTLDWNDEHITWLGLKEGLAKAKKTGKPLMVLRYATWCDACKEFTSLFKDERLVKASKKLIMVRVDVDGEEAELAEQKLGEHHSIPHVVFLGSSHTRLPLAAEDTGTSEHPYFYGDDVKKLVHNMRTALRDEEVFKPFEDGMKPTELLGKEIFDSSMLFPCPDKWRVKSDRRGEKLVCVIGNADNPRDVYSLELDEKKRVRRFTGFGRYNPETELASMRAKKKRMLQDVKKWKCSKIDVKLPGEIPEKVREEMGGKLSHFECKGFEFTFMYDELGMITLIVAPDREGLNDFMATAREKLAP